MTARAGLLVDSADYYRAIYECACDAKDYILLCGWDFDSSVELLRGRDAEPAAYPVRLEALLSALCDAKPNLRVYVLAWDYSMVFALEREWMQRLRFDWMTPDSLTFRFDSKHAPGASHHQKMAVFDGKVAFVGGIDLTSSRWDDRVHSVHNPHRDRNQPPYHDAAGFVTGALAVRVADVFVERWQRATGELLSLPPARSSDGIELVGTLPVGCGRFGLETTYAPLDDAPGVYQVRDFYLRNIHDAEHSIYLETQYFTSREIHDALVERMRDRRKPRLNLVLIMPENAGSPKERLTLGDAQEEILASLCSVAASSGCHLRAYYSAGHDANGDEVVTFIHSKIAIFDDRVFSVGSANLTNRSMRLDTELNLSFTAEHPHDALVADIAAIRASLIAEHAGLSVSEAAASPRELLPHTDSLCRPESKLRQRKIVPPASEGERVIRLEKIFDPERPLTELELGEVLG
jgi:phosphatidylserine/phosphatidylglycerophosphate/cardiolipin synthase-like enzyme